MTPDVNVHLLDFSNYGKEMIVKNEDDTYTILINAKLSHDAQIAAYEHAMRHITRDDFDKEPECVQEIEAAAHQVPDVPVPAPFQNLLLLSPKTSNNHQSEGDAGAIVKKNNMRRID